MSAPFVPGVLPEEVIRPSLTSSLLVTDHFYPAIMSVLFAGTAPETAIAALSDDRKRSENEPSASTAEPEDA